MLLLIRQGGWSISHCTQKAALQENAQDFSRRLQELRKLEREHAQLSSTSSIEHRS